MLLSFSCANVAASYQVPRYRASAAFQVARSPSFGSYLGKAGAKKSPGSAELCGSILCCRTVTAARRALVSLSPFEVLPTSGASAEIFTGRCLRGVGNYGVVIGRLLCDVVLYGGVGLVSRAAASALRRFISASCAAINSVQFQPFRVHLVKSGGLVGNKGERRRFPLVLAEGFDGGGYKSSTDMAIGCSRSEHVMTEYQANKSQACGRGFATFLGGIRYSRLPNACEGRLPRLRSPLYGVWQWLWKR